MAGFFGDGRQAAVSLTFDDGLDVHFTCAPPHPTHPTPPDTCPCLPSVAPGRAAAT